jgi:hypothetical protein
MTPPEKKRLAFWLALIVAFWPLLAALDSRYVKHQELQRVESKLDRILDAVCTDSAKRVCQ